LQGSREWSPQRCANLFKQTGARHKADDERRGNVAESKERVEQVSADERGDNAAQQPADGADPRPMMAERITVPIASRYSGSLSCSAI
jgi:hypothetical protein